jgi:proton-dependent oligopeptide transporter, POT family
MSESMVGAKADASWFGHPKQLARLFTTEMWERFGYYGMRALLTLYLTQHFLFSDSTAGGLYGGFTALVYLTPLIGGLIADRYLGSKRSVKFGAIVMSLGYLVLCFGGPTAKPYALIDGQRHEVVMQQSGQTMQQFVVLEGRNLLIRGNEDKSVSLLAGSEEVRRIPEGGFESAGERKQLFTFLLLLGLSLVTVGNGFFKPNISTMVGALYPQGDRRRDAGFTIFYMGINLGALLSQLLCPWLAVAVDWWAGFLLAALGMACSWVLIQFDGGALDGVGETPAQKGPDRTMLIYLGAALAVPVVWLLLSNVMNTPKPAAGAGLLGYFFSLPIMGKALFITFVGAIPGILYWSWRNGNRTEFEMMVAAMILIVFNVVFWTLFEQAGSSLTLFAERNTNLSVFGLFSITAGQTQFFNAAFIVIFAPVMTLLWNAMGKNGIEPSIPVKFGIGLIGAGAGFLLLVWGAGFAGPDFKVGLWWLAGLYLIHSIAELCISPVGLSMITKLSIARIVGLMMGVWFLSISFAQFVAGLIAQSASVETVGGQVTNLKVSLDSYVAVFNKIGWIAVVIGLFLVLLAVPLRKLMHGVK